MQNPTSPTDPQLTLSSTLGGLTVALQVHLAPAAWQPPCAAQTADEASAALAGLSSALAAEMPQALDQARQRLQRSLEVALVLQAQAQLATALGSHDGAAAADTPAAPPEPAAPASTADIAEKFNAWVSATGLTGDAKKAGIVFLSTDTQPVSREALLEWLSRPLPRVESATTAELPPHPSRIAHHCSQCAYYVAGVMAKCDHPLQPVWCGTGNPMANCCDARSDMQTPRVVRDGVVSCGSIARLFKARQAA